MSEISKKASQIKVKGGGGGNALQKLFWSDLSFFMFNTYVIY